MPTPKTTHLFLYTLTEEDAAAINRRRTTGASIAERIRADAWPLGAQAHIGNPVQAGEQVPMIPVRLWPDSTVSGQALLDGTDTFWVIGVKQGTGPGTWQLPAAPPAPRPAQRPSISRDVHYLAYGTPGGEFQAGAHRAAKIVEVELDKTGAYQTGRVKLFVMNPTGVFFTDWLEEDPSATRPGSWHWPEFV